MPVEDDRRAAERAQLERYIADSLRLRRRLTRALAPVAVAALVLTFIDRTPGLIALVIALSSIGVGIYITSAHVADWRARLTKLADPGRAIATRGRRRG